MSSAQVHNAKENDVTESPFVDYTADTAPADARRLVQNAEKAFGYVPSPVARMAASPHLLEAFMKVNGIFEQTTLSPLEREVLIMTLATEFGCHYCVAMHTGKLVVQNAPEEVVSTLRAKEILADPRLEALRLFTLAVVETRGQVAPDDLGSFQAAGYTLQNALEVILGVGTYTLSTFANRMTAAPLDAAFEKFRWDEVTKP